VLASILKVNRISRVQTRITFHVTNYASERPHSLNLTTKSLRVWQTVTPSLCGFLVFFHGTFHNHFVLTYLILCSTVLPFCCLFSRTSLSGYIFATKARIDNREKNLLSSNISPTYRYNMVNFGPLAAEIVSLVWGTPVNFDGFRVLAALLHSQTAALNRGHHLHSAGRPSRWALAHISSFVLFCFLEK